MSYRLTIAHTAPKLEAVKAMLMRLAYGEPYGNQVLTRKVTISRPKKGQPTEYEEVVLECPAGDFGVKLRRKGGTITVELYQAA